MPNLSTASATRFRTRRRDNFYCRKTELRYRRGLDFEVYSELCVPNTHKGITCRQARKFQRSEYARRSYRIVRPHVIGRSISLLILDPFRHSIAAPVAGKQTRLSATSGDGGGFGRSQNRRPFFPDRLRGNPELKQTPSLTLPSVPFVTLHLVTVA